MSSAIAPIAQALFESAKERNYLDQADQQLATLQAIFEKDRSLIAYLTAPQVTDEKKRAVIRNIFSKGFERGILEFMLLVARKRREAFIPEIIENFRELVADHRGALKAVVTTAHKLEDAQRAKLNQKLATRTGKKIEIIERIDGRVIGGVRVRLKDKEIDGSVSHALAMIRENLEALEVN